MWKRAKICVFVGGCMALLTVASSLALWSGRIEHTNQLEADQMSAKIVEVFDEDSEPKGTVNKEVSFQNNSSCAAFLRVSYAENWYSYGFGQNLDGFTLNNQVNGKDAAVKNWENGFGTNSDLWQVGDDGWYYYKKILKPGETTGPVLKSVTFRDDLPANEFGNPYDTAAYNLYFRMELLQASDSGATLNRDQVNRDASQAVFGKKAIVNGDSVTWE